MIVSEIEKAELLRSVDVRFQSIVRRLFIDHELLEKVLEQAKKLPDRVNDVLALHVQDQNDVQFAPKEIIELAEARLKLDEAIEALEKGRKLALATIPPHK